MAHQTNVHHVGKDFKAPEPSAKVTDPVCGKQMEEQQSKHMVFRKEDTFFFCSRECKDKFIDPAFSRRKKSA